MLSVSDLYERAVETLPKDDIDHYESDLYLRKSEASTKLVNDYEFSHNVTTFVDEIDHVQWYDVPFAYCG